MVGGTEGRGRRQGVQGSEVQFPTQAAEKHWQRDIWPQEPGTAVRGQAQLSRNYPLPTRPGPNPHAGVNELSLEGVSG